MAKSLVEPEGEGDDALAIDIDPELIEAALAAVESRARRSQGDEPGVDTASVAPEPVVRSGPTSRPPSVAPRDEPTTDPISTTAGRSEDARLLAMRAREQAERLRRLEGELGRVTEARDALDQQYRELRQGAQSLQAEMDALRVRARKDRDEAERVGEERVLRGVLDIVENVERGVSHAEQDPARVLAGLTMIAEQFRMLLRRIGIDRIEASRGTPFNPALHEAVLHMPTDEVAPGEIHSEVAAGFTMRGRLVRPARVVVGSSPGTA